jgi:hypothetical protein
LSCIYGIDKNKRNGEDTEGKMFGRFLRRISEKAEEKAEERTPGEEPIEEGEEFIAQGTFHDDPATPFGIYLFDPYYYGFHRGEKAPWED